MRGLDGEPPAKVFLHCGPPVLVADLPTPSAHPKKTFEIKKPLHYPPSENNHNQPHDHYGRSFHHGLVYAGGILGAAENQSGQTYQLIQPRQRNEEQEADGFIPQYPMNVFAIYHSDVR
jgi:hypothetical protein